MTAGVGLFDPLGLVWSCALVGLLIGSFLNVVIARLPVMMERAWAAECADPLAAAPVASVPRFNLIEPPSRCPSCAAPIRAWQNIPLLSWIALRGRCASCRQPISPRYPFVEVLTALLSAGVAAQFGASLQTATALLMVWTLIALAFIDLDTQYLPDDLTQPLLWGGLLANSAGAFVPLQDAVWGAAAGYLLLWSVYWAFRLLTGREGMGAGDFKLLAALGAWLGYQVLPSVILLSSILGAACGIAAIALAGHDRRAPISFGPFLVFAGLAALFFRAALLP